MIAHAQDVRWPNIFIAPTLPIINADRGQLVLVRQNLVDNAFKFCSDQRRPVVSIGVRKETDFPVYLVKDNGIGIESRFQERIFDLFERIDSEFEGSAVGLALVRRIIEAHGGKVWVESEGEDRGATLCFTLMGCGQHPE